MGERFGQFEIERPLGVGGMAETAQAIRRGLDGFEQRVCLKRILPAFGRDAEFVRAFQNEAKLAVRLVHPHICRIYDFGSHESTWWMSMELVEAGDLRTLFDRVEKLGQPLPVDLVLLLAVDLASALHHAHSFRIDGRPAEIVHRDISPSNVLIDSAGHFKLADFGIAKATLSGEGGTRTGTIKGKVPYMAPEHARGEKIDGRADLWSFGVVLYEALAGRRPFRGAHDVELLLNVAGGVYEPIATAAPHTPPVLQRVVTGLLEASPERRIAKAADVLELLAQTPPPANARLRLAELSIRIAEERHRGDERGLGEAPTAFSDDGSTARSASERTFMAADGVALGIAPQPVSAPAEARTRTAMASIPSLETKPLDIKPASTDPNFALPTAVREAIAIDAALVDADTARTAASVPPTDPSRGSPRGPHASGPTPFVVEGRPIPPAEASAASSSRPWLAQIIAASALVGLVGVGLSAWGLGAFDARPSADTLPTATAALGATGAPVGPRAAAAPVAALPAAAPPVAASPVAASPVVEDGRPPAAAPAVAVGTPTPDLADPTPASGGAAGGERDARRTGTLVIGIVGFGSVWVDGRRVAESTDHVERRVRAGRHTVAAGIDSPHETRVVEVAAGESVEILLHAR